MATQFEIDCALMAGASYIDTRALINRFPIPTDWVKITTPVDSHVSDPSTGFEAIAFTNGTEIVISFAGTNPLQHSLCVLYKQRRSTRQLNKRNLDSRHV